MSSHGPEMSRWIPETLQTRVELQPKDTAPETLFMQDYYSPEEARKYDTFNRRYESTSWTTKEARQGITNYAVRNGGSSPLTPMMRFGGMQGTFIGKPVSTLTPAYQVGPKTGAPYSEVESEMNKYGNPSEVYGVTRTTRPVPMHMAQEMTHAPSTPPNPGFVLSPGPSPGPSPVPVPTHLEEDFECANVDIVTNKGVGKFFSSTFIWLGKLFQCTYYKSWKGFFHDLSSGESFGKALTKNYRIVYFLLALGFVILVIAIITVIATPSKPTIERIANPNTPTAGVINSGVSSSAATTESVAIQNAMLKQQVADQQQELTSLQGRVRVLGQGSNPTMYTPSSPTSE